MSSRIRSFYRLTPDERYAALIEQAGVPSAVVQSLKGPGLTTGIADGMVENVVGTYSLPNAIAVNLLMDGRDRLVPMVVEEPSVVAAVSNMARLTRLAGGITTSSDPSHMIGQVHVPNVANPDEVSDVLREALPQLTELAKRVHPRLTERGGGVRSLRVRTVRYDEPGFPVEDMVVLEFVLDCVDAMGANMINTVAETLAPQVEQLTGTSVGLRILSNLASERLARATCTLPFAVLDSDPEHGRQIAEGIASAWRFAWADPWRATTHNKGVMNGIDAVALATGNDWRAIEAGAHAWCSRDGTYRPMTTWRVADGALHGHIELPMQFGTVGGTLRVHPRARANLALANIDGASDLARLAVAVGLIQNLGALRALATEGIQAGHMRMHARSVAIGVGAEPSEIGAVVHMMCSQQDYSATSAAAALTALRNAHS